MASVKTEKNTTPANGTPATEATDATTARKKVLTDADKKEIKALFEASYKADEKVEQARQALDAAINARSLAVKAIHDKTQHKGPFTYNGDEVKIVVRKSARGENWFFRGKNEQESIDIG